MHFYAVTRMESCASFGLLRNLKKQVFSTNLNRMHFWVQFYTFTDVRAVSINSIRQAAFVMAIMSDALAKEAHHEIRMDESSGAIASVQGSYTVIFSCDGKPPSTVYTEHLPCTFVHVPGPASLAPKVTHTGELSLNFHSKLFKAKFNKFVAGAGASL